MRNTESGKWVLAIGVAVGPAIAGGRGARAEDAAEDAAALLRRARAAETVDRDFKGAIDLYKKVFDAPASEAGRDAGLRLLELLESRGDPTGALRVATRLTEGYSMRLDDA